MPLRKNPGALPAALMVLVCVGSLGCPTHPEPTPLEDFVVEGLDPTQMLEVNVGEPFTLEARIFLPDGSPATDYEWTWSTDSYGHIEEASHEPPNIERLTVTPTVADQLWISGLLGIDRYTSAGSIRAWGGTPDRIYVSASDVVLAVGERRPIAVYGLGKSLSKGQDAEVLSVGHEPVDLTSSDERVVTVTGSGLLEAKAGGSATITATYGGLSETIAVTVDPDLEMAPPLVGNPRMELYEGGPGIVGPDGYPVIPSSRKGANVELEVSTLSRWTGTGMGHERFLRPVEARGNLDLRYAMGMDNVWLAYSDLQAEPFTDLVVAHRPVDGGPDDWVHREIDLPALAGEGQLVSFQPAKELGLRARPDGGVWVAFTGIGRWLDPESEEEVRLDTFALATVTESETTAEILVVQTPRETFGEELDLLVRQSDDPMRPDVIGLPFAAQPTLLQWDAQAAQWRPGSLVSPLYTPPTTNLFYSSVVQAIDSDDPGRESRLLYVLVAEPSPSDDNGEALVLALPTGGEPMVEPDAEFEYDWYFKRGFAALHRDALYFSTDSGTPVYHWLMADRSELFGSDPVSRFTTTDQFIEGRGNAFDDAFKNSHAGWAFGDGKIYFNAGGVPLPAAPHPLLANDASSTQGRHIGARISGRPAAYADGRVLWNIDQFPVENALFLVTDELNGPTRESRPTATLTPIDVRAVDGLLLSITEDESVYESIDEGASWLFAGPLADQTVDPWAMIDGMGRRHTLQLDRGTLELVWSWYEQGSETPLNTKRLPNPSERNSCTGVGITLATGREIGRTLVTSDGRLIHCRSVSWADVISYSLAGPDDDDWRELRIGLNGAPKTNLDVDHPWDQQAVVLTDGRVIFGFTGRDPRNNQTRAMLVELLPDGTLTAPHVIRPDGGFGQQFRSMEPLPDGGLLVVWRDSGVPDILISQEVAAYDLFTRVDELSPDEELLEAWAELGVVR